MYLKQDMKTGADFCFVSYYFPFLSPPLYRQFLPVIRSDKRRRFRWYV